MRRRRFLAATGTAATFGLSGCLAELGRIYTSNEPPVLSNRPAEPYIPTHVEGMKMVGTADAGDYRVGVFYGYPHRFWVLDDEDGDFGTDLTRPARSDDVHLMATVWDPETGVVVPDTGLSVELFQDGSLVGEEVIYSMLSQQMGFHYGANFGLDGDGTYEVRVSVGAATLNLFGELDGKFQSAAAARLDFEFSARERNDIPFTRLDEKEGDRGAAKPMQMETTPLGRAPEPLPGDPLGSGVASDLRLVGTSLSEPRFGDDAYLAVSAQTPYNKLVVPRTGLSATVSGGGHVRFDGDLEPGLDPELGFHYGATVPELSPEDDIELSVDVPPQVARHEGYETAFLEFDTTTLS
ncbi:iron transporter [Haloferax larsenii]|uniref:Iron transporter n=1 Tax=Haloferax larsenii TaxID=302484 RepID=A0ABY5RCW4_HALLR|nr:iron transporter [Haloferax larsenii]UVE49425.1 iron transporter [Haloferax larsenii]